MRIPEPRSPSEMASLTHDDTILLISQRQEASARPTLVEALCRLGELDEALAIASGEQKRFVQDLIDGENEADETRCDCIATIDTADYVKDQNADPKLTRTPNYNNELRHWSKKYSAMVWFRRCYICGHRQTIASEMDPDHAHRVAEQQQAKEVIYGQVGSFVNGKEVKIVEGPLDR